MKQVTLFLIPIIFYGKLFSQDITGLWAGSLYNDSTKQSVYYEVAISESKGKYSGYSYTTFIVNGKEAIGVKLLKIIHQKDHFFFEDVDLVYNTYPVPPPKGVKQISSVSISETGGVKVLTGKFITTRTKQYGRQVTGILTLEEKKGLTNDKLLAITHHLKTTPQYFNQFLSKF